MSYDLIIPGDSSQLPDFSPDDLEIYKRLTWEKAMDTVVSPLHKAGFAEVQPLGFTASFEGPHVIKSYPNDWTVMKSSKDPLVQSDENYIPDSNRDRMNEMLERLPSGGRGLIPYVAHEIEKIHTREILQTKRIPIQLLKPLPPAQTQVLAANLGMTSDLIIRYGLKLAAAGVLLLPAMAGVTLQAARITGQVAGGVAKGVVTAMLMDPVVFVGVSNSGKCYPGEPTFIVKMASWDLPVAKG